ncbi:c-type cytochrome [Octadecabacter sp. R77987]|uniref:c-type cytochrome n=1 Tax=Octadecabacter sp. R77987 TaxID=3093874 RepID=UPI003670CD41
MRYATIIIATLALAGCVAQSTDVSIEAGAVAFQQDCAACHGTDARGEGDFGRELIRVPPDLTTMTQRYGGQYPRDFVMSTIDGYTRGEHFSAAMPEFGAGDMGATVIVEQDGIGTPVPARLLALSNYLESIQQ